jgi:polyhydroxybutyrate depolymerase
MEDQEQSLQQAREGWSKQRFPLLVPSRFSWYQVILFPCLILACLLAACEAPGSATSAIKTSPLTTLSHSARTAGCGKKSPFLPGTSQDETVSQAHQARLFLLHIPANYQATHAYPLVLNFPGHGSSAAGQERVSGFSHLADQASFLVAYPQGLVGADGKTGWNTGPGNYSHANDLAFTAAILTHIQSQVCVNRRRIYATGFSNGGGMTQVLACRMTAPFAAFAMVSAGIHPVVGGCHPSRAIPLLEIHGTADRVVPYNGNALNDLEPPVSQTLANWAAFDRCASQPVISFPQTQVVVERWQDCRAGTAIVHYRLIGGVHIWPRPGIEPGIDGHSINATAIIWNFLSTYTLPLSHTILADRSEPPVASHASLLPTN